MDRPPEYLTGARVSLRRWRASDAGLCFSMVTQSLDHLRPWMPWAANYGPADAVEYVRRCELDWALGTAFNYLILDTPTGTAAGSAGLMARIGPGGLEIGYWVHQDFTGRGIATAAAAVLTQSAFALPGIDRVEIIHDVLNHASERVPAKLGYQQIETVEGRFDPAPGDSGTSKVWRITR